MGMPRVRKHGKHGATSVNSPASVPGTVLFHPRHVQKKIGAVKVRGDIQVAADLMNSTFSSRDMPLNETV